MKKIVFLITVISACSFASCKKDRTCTCTTTHANGAASDTMVITIIKSTKGVAKKACISETTGTGTDATTTTCALK